MQLAFASRNFLFSVSQLSPSRQTEEHVKKKPRQLKFNCEQNCWTVPIARNAKLPIEPFNSNIEDGVATAEWGALPSSPPSSSSSGSAQVLGPGVLPVVDSSNHTGMQQ